MSDDPQMTTGTPQPAGELRPPASEVGVVGWLSRNLFSSKLSGITTIVLGLIVALVLWGLAQ